MNTLCTATASLLQNIEVCTEENGITAIKIKNKKCIQKEDSLGMQCTKELGEYLSGTRTTFSVPLKPQGTVFQKAVWKAIARIPYGETRTYKQVAEMVGKPNAARAVGNALNKNPHCIIVPCHRVVPSNGTMGKYAYGETVKRMLLEMERGALLSC